MADALDDFLTGKTATPPKDAGAPSPDKLDAFLTGAAAKPAQQPPPPEPVNALDLPWSSDYGQGLPPDVVRSIGNSAVQGYQNVPSFWTAPDGSSTRARVENMDPYGFGRFIVAPAGDIYAGVMGVGGGLLRGIQETARQTLDPINPLLARDVAALPEAFPFGPPGKSSPQAGPRANLLMDTVNRWADERAAQNALDARNSYQQGSAPYRQQPPPTGTPADQVPPGIPPGTPVPTVLRLRAAIDAAGTPPPTDVPQNTINALTGQPEPVRVPPGAAGPTTVPYAPPRSAAPPEPPPTAPTAPPAAGSNIIPNGLTPEQVAEFRNIPEALPPMTGEIKTPADAAARADQIIQHFASIGNKEPIPGAEGALPTITGNSGLATLYRAVRDSDTPVPFTTLEDAAKTKAGAKLAELVQTPDALDAAEKALDAKTEPMRTAAFANKTEADPTPVVATIDHILASPSGMSDAVVSNLRKIRDKLVDKDGNILDRAKDPEQLYGLDKAIRKDLSPLAAGTTSDARLAAHEMMNVQDVLRPVIEGAAPGFKDYMATYSKDSRPLDEMRYLQSRNLTNMMDQTTLGKVDSMLKDIDKQRNAPGIKLPDSLSPETLETLRAVRDQMQRENFTATAGKSLGSNTFQNLATNTRIGNIAGHVGNALLSTGTGAAIDLAAGGGGATGAVIGAAASGVMKGIEARQAARAAAQQEAGRQMLMKELRDRLLNIDNKGVQSLNQPPSAPTR